MKMRQRRRALARSPNRHFVAQVVTWRQQVRQRWHAREGGK